MTRMEAPKPKIEEIENSASAVDDGNSMELRNNDDATPTIAKQAVVVEEKTENEVEPGQEQEKIQKAIAFWSHPAVRDVPSAEKLSYLHEQQGLTTAQIHKAWEKMVGAPRVGAENNNHTKNHTDSMQQQYSYHHHHQRNNHHTNNNNHGPSNEPPYHPTPGSNYGYNNSNPNYNMMNNDRQQHPFPSPLWNDPSLAMDKTDGSISVARGVSLLGVGGFLGVTGAAAVRWLNGGRFELFPPSATTVAARIHTTGTTSTSRSTSASNEQEKQGDAHISKEGTHPNWQGNQGVRNATNESSNLNNNNDYEEEEDYNEAEYSDNEEEEFEMEEILLERIDALLSSIDSNSALQEKLFLKLANTSTITDDSMSLLKQNIGSTIHNSGNNSDNKQSNTAGISGCPSTVLAELKEVKDGLVSLHESMMHDVASKRGPANEKDEDWHKEWSKLVTKFESCIQTIEKPTDAFVVDTDPVDNKSLSTSETTQTESQERHDIPSLPAAPSTPATDTNSSATTTAPAIPLSLNDCIRKVVEKNNTVNLISGSQLLYLYLANLSGKPDNRRYRKIYTSNESFQKVENLIGGKDLLQAVGFVEESDKGVLEWVPTGSTDTEIAALILVKDAAAALSVLKKPGNIPSSELIELALSKLSASPSLFTSPHQQEPSLPLQHQGNNESDNGSVERRLDYHDHQDVPMPQTPVGSSLLSPPMPKKIPFVPTPTPSADVIA